MTAPAALPDVTMTLRRSAVASSARPHPGHGVSRGGSGITSLDAGMRVGPYELVAEIGRGSTAVVYAARQPSLDRMVAVKRLRPEADAAAVTRFVDEARMLGALAHPNVVSVLDLAEDDGSPCIVMELLEHGSLRPWIGRLTHPQAFGVLEDLLAGLDHAAAHGVAHRDLKPENVLLARDGTAKIADFGLAGDTDVAGGPWALGTPAYMAPEQVRHSDVGPAADLYAVGVMAYEMLSGQRPFDGPTVPVVLLRHLDERPAPLAAVAPSVDPRVAAWVEQLLEKDPRDRFDSARAAWRALEPVVVAAHGAFWRRRASLAGGLGAGVPEGTPAPAVRPS